MRPKLLEPPRNSIWRRALWVSFSIENSSHDRTKKFVIADNFAQLNKTAYEAYEEIQANFHKLRFKSMDDVEKFC